MSPRPEAASANHATPRAKSAAQGVPWAGLNPGARRFFSHRSRYAALQQNARTMTRLAVTEKIIATKVAQGIQWSDVAVKVGLSKEWVTAACLGQMTLNAEQAGVVAEIFGLTPEETNWLMVVPYKGSLPTSVPTDPLIYRFFELISVYGTTFKALIHEEFGDGIMSAIDFKMDLQREPNPLGDRVSITMSGKFLPYKAY